MVIHFLRIKVAPQDRTNAIRTIQSTIGPTKARQHCLTCSLYSHVDNDDELLLLQKWESDEALERYLTSPSYHTLIEGLELSYEEPIVEFHTVSGSTDLDYVEKIRHLSGA